MCVPSTSYPPCGLATICPFALAVLCVFLTLAALYGYQAGAQRGGTTPAYTFTDLPGLPGLTYQGRPYTQSDAWAINDAGQIAGDSYTQGPTSADVERHPVIWHRDAGSTHAASAQGRQRQRTDDREAS